MGSVLSFGKYQGLGNDFLVVDLRYQHLEPSPERKSDGGFEIARWLCDRRRGIGGDGVLTLRAGTSAGAVASMRVLNADGSEAEMCGNGLRCVAKYLLEMDETRPESVTVDTGAGPLLCRAEWDGEAVAGITVNMGRPRLERSEIPMRGTGQCLSAPYEIQGRSLAVSAVNMGNPHAVSFVPEANEALMALAIALGPDLETHTDFPERCNAEFAHILSPSELQLVVWERGVGITQACGTGACATAVAACKAGLCQLGSEIEVRLPGGSLWITVAEGYEQVLMRGPALHVFDGQVELLGLS